MKISIIIKSIFIVVASLLTSTTLASAYSSYLPIVDSKPLSIIITVTMLLGLVAMYQKRT
ncbi:hypothetical protein SP60_08175 [Candidatus Thioglobus autotrophicus]|uniref:Uncharacterized protein n=1 Tax=Candidatus Thioglobus autotrophicus TaxID=1705394 RepID=A0A0M4NK55_9GAMM|nr:hypothetical protein [Candidatus Thioglobus autotrophicus]ALE53163.1 hypothetical protein SP60_08175 [Candidatus Thioglobus autotrophicus]WPE15796.1 hypothetical protein R5P06_04375 [Candidatus Thioglobus autotrophicus]